MRVPRLRGRSSVALAAAGLLVLAVALAGCLEGEESRATDQKVFAETATPGSPAGAVIGVTDAIQSVGAEVTLTNVENATDAAGVTMNATVIFLTNSREIHNETVTLAPDGYHHISLRFGRDIIEYALLEDEPNRVIKMEVRTDAGVLSVQGQLTASTVM